MASCRNVEGLRRNWEAIRREEREFGHQSASAPESSDDEPGDNLSLADRASILRAKRIMEEQKSRQSNSLACFLHLFVEAGLRCFLVDIAKLSALTPLNMQTSKCSSTTPMSQAMM